MRTRRVHYLVWHEDDIKKLLVFTNCPLVKKFAYIKHQGDSEQYPHYHFYFVISGSDEFLFKLNGVNDRYCVDCRAKESDIINYFLRSPYGCEVDLQSFKTNIEGYKNYNGISRINNKNGV